MSIIKTLADITTTDAEKLEAVNAVVIKARASYGNTDAEVASPYVPTTHGDVSFESLMDDSKVAILLNQAQRIRVAAVEFSHDNTGANVNKKIEELIALDGYMCNIVSKNDLDYL